GFVMAGTIIGLVGYGLWVAHDRALAAAALETGRLSRAFEQHTAQTVEVIDRTLSAAAAYIKSQPTPPPPFDRTIASELPPLLTGAPQMVGIRVLDRTGKVVQDSRPDVTSAPAPLFRAEIERRLADASGALQVSGLLTIADGPQQVFAISRRIASGGEATGLVIAYVDPAYFVRLYSQISVGKTGMIMLLRNDGTVLARQPAVPIGR